MTTIREKTVIHEKPTQVAEHVPVKFRTSARRPLNVATRERLASSLLGGVLVWQGVKRRTIPGLLTAIAGGAMVQRGLSGHCAVYKTLGIDTAHQGQAVPHDFFENGIRVEESVTVNRPPQELYQFWHSFENLPKFMSHLRSVNVIDETRSHWTAHAPADTSVEWDAVIINDEPNSLIAWKSLQGADVDNAGSVRFIPAPGDRGTEVRVVIEYIPPAGRLGATVAKLFGEEPSQQIHKDLRQFKQIMETGEIPTTQGQPQGHCS